MNYLKRTRFFDDIPWRLLGGLLVLMVVIMVCYAVTAAWRPGIFSLQLAFISMCGALLMGGLCLCSSWRCRNRHARKRTIYLSQLLWGLGGFVFAAGQFDLFIQILITHSLPLYPSSSHIIQLFTYAFFIVAVLLLPAYNLCPLARLRILVDSLIIMVAVATLCYYFVLAPLLKGHVTDADEIVSNIYLVLDLLALLSVLVVALYSNERALWPVLLILGVAVTLQLLGDILHFSEMLYAEYNYFSSAHAGKMLYGMLLPVAAQTLNNILSRKKIGAPSTSLPQNDLATRYTSWIIFLPSALVLLFILLVGIIWLRGTQAFVGQIAVIYLGGFTVLVLMVLRHLLIVSQINKLRTSLREKNDSLHTLNERLERQASTDPLTDLPNHRVLAEKLDAALAQAQTTSTPCSIIFIDIDNFKYVNDYYGHQIGDAVLGYFAQIVRATVRAEDSVGRWGGEEFLVILPGTGTDEARNMAELIRVAVRSRGPVREGEIGLTCSLGVAGCPQDTCEREELLRYADQAMYVAKQLGRDQVRSAHEPAVLALRDAALPVERDEEAYIAGVAEALLALVEAREPALARHARRVSELSWCLARELDLTPWQARMVSLGGLLHNLGDIAMPDPLLRHYDPLDEKELEIRARYAQIGADILAPLPALRPIASIVRTQCAWMEAAVPPEHRQSLPVPQPCEKCTVLCLPVARLTGLSQDLPRTPGDCTLGARIVAVADAYEMLCGEPFPGQGDSSATSLRKMRQASGSRFDPRVIEALTRIHTVVSRPAGGDMDREYR